MMNVFDLDELMMKWNTIRATVYTSIEHNLDEGSHWFVKIEALASEANLIMKRCDSLPAHLIFLRTCDLGESMIYDLESKLLAKVPGISLKFESQLIGWPKIPEYPAYATFPNYPRFTPYF